MQISSKWYRSKGFKGDAFPSTLFSDTKNNSSIGICSFLVASTVIAVPNTKNNYLNKENNNNNNKNEDDDN